MAWIEVLDAMRGCCVCGVSFHRLRYPKLLPCCHTLACDICLAQYSQVQCPVCQQVHSQILPEPFFEQLMQYVSSFYFDERMSGEQKEAEAGKVKKQLDEYFVRIEHQHTNPSDSQGEPSAEEIANTEESLQPAPPQLPDLFSLPAIPIDGEVSDSWQCSVCSQSSISITEYRCPFCQRVNFSVYQKVTQQSVDLPESLERIFAAEDKPTSTEVISTTDGLQPPTVPDFPGSSIFPMAEFTCSRYCNACDLPSVPEPVYACSVCRLTKTPQAPEFQTEEVGEEAAYTPSAPQEPLVGDFPPPADNAKNKTVEEEKKPEAKPASTAPESMSPVSAESKGVLQSKPQVPNEGKDDKRSDKPRAQCCAACTVA